MQIVRMSVESTDTSGITHKQLNYSLKYDSYTEISAMFNYIISSPLNIYLFTNNQ